MPEAKKIRAVLLWVDHPVHVLPDDDNGPEWFKDPARDIMVLHMFGGPTEVRGRESMPDLPNDRFVLCLRDLYQFLREQKPPISEEEVLLITDHEGRIADSDGLDTGHMTVARIGYRTILTVDRIVREIYRVEHERERNQSGR